MPRNKNKGCEYGKLCYRQDRKPQSFVSYWPRDERVYPLCDGKEDPTQCMVYSFWRENPELRHETERQSTPLRVAVYSGLGIAAGSALLLSCPTSSVATFTGAGIAAAGGCILLESLFLHYTGKPLSKWRRDKNERSGIEEIYEKILKAADKVEEPDPDAVQAKPLTSNYPIKGLTRSPRNLKMLEKDGVKFNASIMHISFPLTTDMTLYAEKDDGVMLQYQDEEPTGPGTPPPLLCRIGVREPYIRKRRLERGRGFIGYTAHTLFPLPIPVRRGDVMGLGVPVLSRETEKSETVKKIFGTAKQFNEFAEQLEDKKRMNIRTLYRLMQDVLYSDF